uniref:Uncharacterized protein n=1 Tax=Anguilla anguilla TaxID=7936 RepID=A0A0E9QXA7_ANGAN
MRWGGTFRRIFLFFKKTFDSLVSGKMNKSLSSSSSSSSSSEVH